MGWLSKWFGGGRPANLQIEPDSIWLTEAAKYRGIARDLESTGG